MKDLALDSNNDVVLEAGDLTLVTGDDWIRQDIQQQLQFFSGEWFLDTTQGLPYFQYILIKNPNLDIVQALIQDTITGVEGVKELDGFEFGYDPESRQVTISVTARTTNGQVIKPQAQLGPTPGTTGGST